MEIIEQIGSYAGLAAIVGLAVLSALYFSQARDVRRLREGHQGEASEPVPAEEAQARGPKRPTAAVVPAQDVPAGAAEESEEPAAAGKESNGKEEERAAPAATGTAAAAGAAAVAASNAGGTKAPPAETQVGAPPVEHGNADTPPPRPTPARLPPARPGATAAALRSASSPAAAPSPTTGAPKRPWYRALPPRYLALIVAGVVVVSAGAVYAFAALIGEGEAGSGEVASENAGSGGDAAPLDPSTITVAVLNGTDVAGLAGQIADSVEAAGFQRGNVSNAPEQGGTAESAVLFADGAERAARQVGQELGISQIEPIDQQSRALAGTADVVVIVGADQAD